jgi:DNA polymerase-3 subunit beta
MPLPTPQAVLSVIKVSGMDLKKLVDHTAYATSNERPQYLGGCWYTEDSRLVSNTTDGTIRLTESSVVVDGEMAAVVIPRRSLDAIGKIFAPSPEVTLQSAGNILSVRDEDRTLQTVLLNTDFPSFKKIFGLKGKHTVKVARDALRSALTCLSSVIGDPPGVILTVEPGKVGISLSREDVGEGENEVEVEYTGEGVKVKMNYYVLTSTLDKLPGTEVVMTIGDNQGTPIILNVPGEEGLKVAITPMHMG